MHHPNDRQDTGQPARPLYVFNGGFLTQTRVRQILNLSGYHVRLGLPGRGDLVGVWGNSPTAHRGAAVARTRASQVVRIEDAWLRSLFPGRAQNAPPMGLLIDHTGSHYDPETPSDLETLLATHPLETPALLDRAHGCIARLKEAHLTKYSAVDPTLDAPAPGYVLVLDQTEGDASVRASGADRARFLQMLASARREHPKAPILIKTHPETTSGGRAGYFRQADATDGVAWYTDPISPWTLLEGATAVYTVSSQLGFEAILAGHRPRVFGGPFYAGWGLSTDEFPSPRRDRHLTAEQLFAGAVLLYPKWYDPFTDSLCAYETALENLAALTRCWREDRHGWAASGMRLWKRKPLQSFYGQHKPVVFQTAGATPAPPRRAMVWASKATTDPQATRVEDGFLRSRGLGAELVPPVSLVTDMAGIYYDATRPSQLETLIAARQTLRPDQQARVEQLMQALRKTGLTKYTQGGDRPTLPDGHRILVVGQVEDDASLLQGGGEIRTNAGLLAAARRANPEAVLIYKPHPDVEAGLRDGGPDTAACADMVAYRSDPAYLIETVQEVWTMTSLLGFEALIRATPVTTVGIPFYAGWGLTRDLAPIPARRTARPTLGGLVHACLIDYPRYHHPEADMPCPVEAAVAWLAQTDRTAPRTWSNRLLSKAQGLFASHSNWWR